MSKAREDVETILKQLTDMLPGKVDAYGAAQNIPPKLWQAMLEQYRWTSGDTTLPTTDGTFKLCRGDYVLPAALLPHIPRITRILDRLCRIVASPEGDPMGEDPYLDAAGDCIAGAAMRLHLQRHPFDARGPLWTDEMKADAVKPLPTAAVGGPDHEGP